MPDDKWISSAEAAEFLGKDEQFVIKLIVSKVLIGKKQDNQWMVEHNRLEQYKKSWKKLHANVAQIYRGAQEVLLAQYDALFAREQAQHHGTRGALYEQLIRDVLRDYLPQQFYIGSGQVIGSAPSLNADGDIADMSRQTDVVIFDALHHPILLPKYELFPIEGTLATIEVKSTLRKEDLLEALDNIASTKSLRSLEQTQPQQLQVPDDESVESIVEELLQPLSKEEQEQQKIERRRSCNQWLDQQYPLGIVLAFKSGPRAETLLKYWKDWNTEHKQEHRAEMICILSENLLLIDTSRVDQFWDLHQLPMMLWQPDKLIAFKSESMFYVFITLLLRRLRVRSAITQGLVETTPMSYFREMTYDIVAEVEAPLAPEALEFARSLGLLDENQQS